MKVRIIFIVLMCGVLFSCNAPKMIFSHEGWQLDTLRSRVSNSQKNMFMRFLENNDLRPFPTFTGDTMDLHFFVTDKNAQTYPFDKYMREKLKSVPLEIDTVCFILANQYVVVKLGGQRKKLEPDMENVKNMITGDYSRYVKTSYSMPNTNMLPSKGEYWRNYIKLKRQKCVLCVDRMVLKNVPYAIIYIVQTEGRDMPFCSKYDVTDFGSIQVLSDVLDYYNGLSDIILDGNQ